MLFPDDLENFGVILKGSSIKDLKKFQIDLKIASL